MGERDFDWNWFINNTWKRENAAGLLRHEGRGGYSNGRYHPYQATNGMDIGPGFDMAYQSEAFKKKAYSTGYTKEELDDTLKVHSISELNNIDAKIRKLGGDPSRVSNEVKAGLLDIYHQRKNGLYQEFPKLWDAVVKGDYEGMQRESRTTYKDKQGNKQTDNGRWEFRKNTYFKTPGQQQSQGDQVPYHHVEPSDATRAQRPAMSIPVRKKAFGGYLDDNLWNHLSMKEKAEMMKVAISNGITSLPEIREAYNKFAKGGSKNTWTMQDEYNYRAWRDRLPRNLRNTNDSDYDMRAAFKAGMEPQWNEEDKSYHLGSRDPENGRILKSSHHPTFLKALATDAQLGYYPTMDDQGHTYTETWEGNRYDLGGNLYSRGGRKGVAVNANSQRAMSYLMNKGMSRTGASAIVGTLQAESNLDPTIHAKMKGDDGEGIAQWTGSRKKNFWKTLEQMEPGAQKRYKSITNVPLERQLDVVLSERPDVTNAIHGAKDVDTATDIMLRGYENGGGTVKTMASKGQMDSIYGKWNNGYSNQIRKRLGNANVLLGSHIDPSSYEIPQGFFADIDQQIQIPTMQFSSNDIDPSTLYQPPTIDATLFANPKPTEEEAPVYNPNEERLEGLRNLGSVMGMLGQSNPLVSLSNGDAPGLLSYVSQIYRR